MTRKKVTLALQGGGAHGAFTWGVLDAFLADGRLDIRGVSGTSAGAMNAVVLADGMREGGPARARVQLAEFWRAISVDGKMTDVQRGLFDVFFSAFQPLEIGRNMMERATSYFSPYDFNPLDINPLREVVAKLIDFPKLRASDDLKLFIAATNVQTGKIRVFRRPELTEDMLMASACLPMMFKAVTIENIPYWDGGYSGNPPLFPLFTETDCPEVILVQINPTERKETPRSATQIMNRLNEITLNAPLLGEFRAIDFVTRLLDAGHLKDTHYKRVRMHIVEGGPALAAFSADTKNRSDFSFLERLFALGRTAGEAFLKDNFDAIGTHGTFEPAQHLG